MDGRSTPYREMGHVYADAKGLPYRFERDAERWARESGCVMLKNKTEAWGAYHTNNPEREHPEIEHWKAHEIATKKYDYQKEATAYYGNLEKHKKNK